MKNTQKSTNTNVLPFRKSAKRELAPSASQGRPSAQRLVETLERKARDLGQDLTQLADEIKVTNGYLAQLKSGLRSAATLSDDFTGACAEYLGVSRFTVLLMAGRITIHDMFTGGQDAANKEAFDALCAKREMHDVLATLAAMEHVILQRRQA